jgi:magnesium transporter
MPPPAEPDERLTVGDLQDAWRLLSDDERAGGFAMLSRAEAEELLLGVGAQDQAKIVLNLPLADRRSWMRLLPPDDAADLVQAAPEEQRHPLLELLDEPTRREVNGLLAYAEDQAGGLMNPRYARVRPDVTVDEAIIYLKKQARGTLETLYYIYVLDEQQRLLGVVSLRELFRAQPEKRVREIMKTDLVTVPVELDQEAVSRLFAQHDFVAMPVVDADGRMKGVVTIDDIVDVVQEEATEDIQKFGGVTALGAPYLSVALRRMVRYRGGWLAVLFVGEMLTATAMAHYEDEIARAVVLALFVPLIISSGGNAGSQASTLVIRAMALGEVRLRDWWRVARRELVTGSILGAMLGLIGFVRVVVWQAVRPVYGEHYLKIAATVFFSLLGVVSFGALSGSMLPFALRRAGFDPASASAPFVATLVDVTGLVIYFSVASLLLTGTVL